MARGSVLRIAAFGMAVPGKRGIVMERPLIILGAVAVAAVLFFGIVAVGPDIGPPPPPVRYPAIDCDPECNRLAGGGPRPANEVSIAVNPNDPNNIVAAANDYGTPNSDAWVGYYTTFDGGKTWNRSLVPGYRPNANPVPQPCAGGQLPTQGLCGFEGAGDPVLAVDSEGNFYLAGIAFKRSQITVGRTSAIFVAKSTDGGVTFPSVSIIFTGATKATFHDKEWIAVDPNTQDVYVSWTVFAGLVASQIFVRHSGDGGATWDNPVLISNATAPQLPGVQGSQVEVDNNGTVHAAWIDYTTPNELLYANSHDHGSTWSAPVGLSPVTPISSPQGNTTYRTPTMPDMAIDLTNGTYAGSIYIWWPDEATGDADIRQVFSRDGGETWSNATTVNNDGEASRKSQFFPAVSVAGNGWVIGEFYDRRLDENNTLLSVFAAISVDGGASYPLQFNLTDQLIDGDNSAGASGTGFIGDYLGIASTEWYAMGVWCDMRNAENGSGTDIYAAKILLAAPPAPQPT